MCIGWLLTRTITGNDKRNPLIEIRSAGHILQARVSLEVMCERYPDCPVFLSAGYSTGVCCFECVHRKEPSLGLETGQFPGPKEDFCKHGAVQPTGVGVA